jgi:8-oxo-dGTP diphosphatase
MEIWDLVDGSRNPIGKLHTRGEETLPGEYHIVVEVLTINRDGKILVTQRDAAKTYPLLWESTGGSVNAGETSLQGAIRELHEETGLSVRAENLYFIGEMKRGNYFLDSYVWKSEENIDLSDLNLQVGEVCDAKLVTFKEFEEMNTRGEIVPPVWDRWQLYAEKLGDVIKTTPVTSKF